MAMQGPPPPQDYSPLHQHWGEFLVGGWFWWGPPHNRYFWEGNGPVGYVGGPASYTYIPYPGTPQFPWLPQPPQTTQPPTPVPAPPPPASGQPTEVPVKPITGDPDDDSPPSEGCGQPAAYSSAVLKDKLGGIDGDYGFKSPVVANMFSLPVHTQLGWEETPDPNKYVLYETQPRLVKDEQGRLRVLRSGTGGGSVVFAPPQLHDHHAYGDGVLYNSRWPRKLSRAAFLIMSGAPNDGGTDDYADNILAFGLAHPTSALPKLGWYAELESSVGATYAGNLNLFATDDEAAVIADPANYPTLDVQADVRCRGKLTVDGIIDPTGLVLTEQASTPWTAVAGSGAIYVKNTTPSTLVFVNDIGGETTLGSGAGGPADQLEADGDTLDVDSISDGQYLRRAGTSIVGESAIPRVVTAQFGGPGGSITAGDTAWARVPFSGTITRVTLLADVSGSIVVDVWKDTYANYPPTVADTIAAAAKPTLSSAVKSEDSTLAGWTTAVTAGDIIKFSVDSVATVTHVALILEITP